VLGEEPRFIFYGEGTADRMLTPDDMPTAATLDGRVHALHFGSISLVRDPGSSVYEQLMQRESGHRVLSLDPNVRPGLIGDRATYRERLERWVALVDIVKVSRADLAWLYPEKRPVDAIADWLSRGPALVVVTRGEAGAIGMTSRGAIDVPGILVTVQDTVGAGDAFSAGLLGSLDLRGLLNRAALRALGLDDLHACLDFANRAASITCTQSGALPPTLGEVLDDMPQLRGRPAPPC
jgi:fructokinase